MDGQLQPSLFSDPQLTFRGARHEALRAVIAEDRPANGGGREVRIQAALPAAATSHTLQRAEVCSSC